MGFPRVYPIVDTAALGRLGLNVTDAARAMLHGGARILQFRHKGFWSAQTVDLAGLVGALCGKAGAAFVVNDRADYAALLNAGLHVGRDDLSPGDARGMVTGTLGYSTHSLDQLHAADLEPVDYLALGPVFGTLSKEQADPVVGVEMLAKARALTAKPLVAIGGITMETAPAVWAAGADSVALIADLLKGVPSGDGGIAEIRARMRRWMDLAEIRL